MLINRELPDPRQINHLAVRFFVEHIYFALFINFTHNDFTVTVPQRIDRKNPVGISDLINFILFG